MNTKPPRYAAIAEAGRIAAESEEMQIFRRALLNRAAKRRAREGYDEGNQPKMILEDTKMIPYGPILQERNRFQATLELIRDSDYANPWCKAQARGALDDLDFDAYPETGKPDNFTKAFIDARGAIDPDIDI